MTISKDDTIVLDGAGDKSAITERCDQIRESAEASTSDYDRSAWLLDDNLFRPALLVPASVVRLPASLGCRADLLDLVSKP